jgi:transmembrane sensor
VNDEASARRLGRLLRQQSGVDAPAQEAGLVRLLRATRQGAMAPRAKHWHWPAAAVVLLLGALVALKWPAADPLTYDVRGAARIDEHGVSAEAGEPVELRFSDGSRAALSPGARLRVDRASPHGARLWLREGEATLSVVHRQRTRWSVLAGPFEVAVVGTRFSTRWDDELRALSLELYEGAVEVRGGPLGSPARLRAGQRLEATAASFRITPLASAARAAAVAPVAPAPAGTPAATPARAAPALAWSKLFGRGDFAGIMAQAEAMGIERCLATCSPADLRLLADAARYSGKLELAERSLLALRRRSPPRAAAAAFFLGRLFESQGRDAEALGMYEQHLAEAPGGDYAEQALAGLLRVRVRDGDAGGARRAAERYLQKYPEGVHAAAARRALAP